MIFIKAMNKIVAFIVFDVFDVFKRKDKSGTPGGTRTPDT